MTNPILAKVLRYVVVEAETGCWRWTGGFSQSGRRGCFYPNMRVGGARAKGGRVWRVNRLVLTFATVPRLPGESLAAYLQRAILDRAPWEAAHTCDHSYCVNPGHLQWESHPENVQQQARRRAVARRQQTAQQAEEAVA